MCVCVREAGVHSVPTTLYRTSQSLQNTLIELFDYIETEFELPWNDFCSIGQQ